MAEIYKLARPLLKGVKVQILTNVPYVDKDIAKNNMVRDMLTDLPQFTGEVVVGNPIDADCYEMSKLFMESPEIIAPFVFWVYDMRTTHPYPLRDRLKITEPMIATCGPCIQWVEHELIESEQQFTDYKKKVIEDNFFSGVVLREPFGTFGTEDEVIEAAATATVQ